MRRERGDGMTRAGGWIAALTVAAVAGTAAPAPAAGVPGRFETKIAAQSRGGSNAMFAHIVAPKVKGYRWAIDAYKASPSSRTVLTFMFSRTAAHQTEHQASRFTWRLPRRALTMDSDLKPASLVTGKSMGSSGSIKMRLTDSHGRARFPAEEGCTGSISFRTGRFGGRLRFNARDEYFQRISMQGAQVFLYRAHDYRCPPPAEPSRPCPQNLSFSAIDQEAGIAVGAFKTPEGKVDQGVAVVGKSGTADTLHTISVTVAAPEAFEASEDLTSASVDGDISRRWLSGDLSYVAPLATEAVDEHCGGYRSSSGLATGDYTAHFDSIGPVTPASTGLAATLRQEI